MKSKLKIIFLGTPNYIDPIIQTLDKNFDLIKVIRSTSAFQLRVVKQSLSDLKPDLLIVASFGKIIPEEILKISKHGAINIHPSKLPLYRGSSPIQSQILDGITDTATSFILMDEEMDHGPLLSQIPFKIQKDDTLESLCRKMFAKSAEILPEVINNFASGKINPEKQEHYKATFTKLTKKEDGYFDIENPPDTKTLDRMIRAYYPWPTAWTRWNGKIVKFLPEGKIQIEGKKPADLKSFLNGYPEFPIKEF